MKDKLKRGESAAVEMDLKVFMNLMVVLIPMLLVSAEFAKVSVIDIKLPPGGSQHDSASSWKPQDNLLKLTAIITDSVLTLGAKGGFLPSMHYKEFHKYITRGTNEEILLPFYPSQRAVHPVSGRELQESEKSEILLYSCTEAGEIQNGLYTVHGELLLDADNKPLGKVEKGQTVTVLSNPRRSIRVDDPKDYTLKPLSLYDELQNRLMMVRDRFRESEDASNITIAAENNVAYDKIVQIMDKARNAEFSNIAVAKLRS